MRRKSVLLFVQEAFLVIGIASWAPGEAGVVPGALKVGEKLTYDVIYYGVPAGTAVMEVKEFTKFAGVQACRIRAEVRSNELFSLFYPVEDTTQTLVDVGSLLPFRFEKHQKEGKDYSSERVTVFDRKALKVTINEKTVIDIPAGIHDPLSAIYYLRQQDYEEGEDLEIDINDGKNYRVPVKVYGKCKVAYGDGFRDAILIEPVIESFKLKGIFQEKGRMKIWLSDDERRVPLIIQAEVVIGHLDVVLVSGEKRKKRRHWEE